MYTYIYIYIYIIACRTVWGSPIFESFLNDIYAKILNKKEKVICTVQIIFVNSSEKTSYAPNKLSLPNSSRIWTFTGKNYDKAKCWLLIYRIFPKKTEMTLAKLYLLGKKSYGLFFNFFLFLFLTVFNMLTEKICDKASK